MTFLNTNLKLKLKEHKQQQNNTIWLHVYTTENTRILTVENIRGGSQICNDFVLLNSSIQTKNNIFKEQS